MPIPDFQTLMLPVLDQLARGQMPTTPLIAAMADRFQLSDHERQQLLPSGRQAVFANRVHWALSYLGRAGLTDRIARGVYAASDRGRSLLAEPPDRITIPYLRRYPEFRTLRPNDRYTDQSASDSESTELRHDVEATPEERIEAAVALIRADLREKLLQRIVEAPAAFFEQLVLDLLVALGYGTDKEASEVRGKSDDGGIDGVIREDRLGLDLIYVQAKRYAATNPIGPEAIQAFSGALDSHGARKGVFITTSRYTPAAERYAAQLQMKRIVLVDGAQLTSLMLEHSVGVRQKGAALVIQEIDLNYFESDDI